MLKCLPILLLSVVALGSSQAGAPESRVRQLNAAANLLICKTEGARETQLMKQLGTIQSARKMTQCETCDGVRLGDYQAEALRRLRMLREAQTLESLFTYELLYGGINPGAPSARATLLSRVCGGNPSFARKASDFAIESRIRASSPEQLSAPGFVSDLKKFNRDLCVDPSFKKSAEKIAEASLVAFQTPAGRKATSDVGAGLAPLNTLTDEIIKTCKTENENYQKRIASPKSYEPNFAALSTKDTPVYLLKIDQQNKKKFKDGIEFGRAAIAINKSLKKMVESPYGRLLITRSFRKTLGFDSLEINASNVVNACYSIAGKIAGARKQGRGVFEQKDVALAMHELRTGLAESMQDTLPYRYPKVFKPSRSKLEKQLAAEMRAQTDLSAMSGLLNETDLAKASCSAMKSTAAADAHNKYWAERIGYVQAGIGVLGGALSPFTAGASLYVSMAAGAGLTLISSDISLSQVENGSIDARPQMSSQLRTTIESESQEKLASKAEVAKSARDQVAQEETNKDSIRKDRNIAIGLIAGGAAVARASQLIKPTLMRGAVEVTNDYVVAPVLTNTFNTGSLAESITQDVVMQEVTAGITKKFGPKGGRFSVAGPRVRNFDIKTARLDRSTDPISPPQSGAGVEVPLRASTSWPGASEMGNLINTYKPVLAEAKGHPDEKVKVAQVLRKLELEKKASEEKASDKTVEGMANRDHAKRIADYIGKIKKDFGIDAQYIPTPQQNTEVTVRTQNSDYSKNKIDAAKRDEPHRKSLSDLMAPLPKDQQELIKKYPDEPWEQMSPEKRQTRLEVLARGQDGPDEYLPQLTDHFNLVGGANEVQRYLLKTNQGIEVAYGRVERAKKDKMISAQDEITILTEAKGTAEETLKVIQKHLIDQPSVAKEVDVKGTEKLIKSTANRIELLKQELAWSSNKQRAGETSKETEARLKARDDFDSMLVQQVKKVDRSEQRRLEVIALGMKAHETGTRAQGIKGQPGYKPPSPDKLRAIADFKAALIDIGFDPVTAKNETLKLSKVGQLGEIEINIPNIKTDPSGAATLSKRLKALPDADKKEDSPALKPYQDEYIRLHDERVKVSELLAIEENSGKRNEYKKQRELIDQKIKDVEVIYPVTTHMVKIKENIKGILEQRRQQAGSEDAARVAQEEQELQKEKAANRENAIKQQTLEAESDARARAEAFRANNSDYAAVKKNYNVRKVREQVSMMAENGVVPKAGELKDFIQDVATDYKKSTYSERQRLGEGFNQLLKNADPSAVRKDKGTLDLLNQLSNEPDYPAPKALKEWIKMNIDSDVPRTLTD